MGDSIVFSCSMYVLIKTAVIARNKEYNIRHFKEKDKWWYYMLAGSESTAKLMNSNVIRDKSSVDKLFNSIYDSYKRPEQWRGFKFAVTDKTDRFIGFVGVKIDRKNCAVEIGYAVSETERGRGIGKSAVRCICRKCEKAGASEIRMRIYGHNTASRHIAEYCGLRCVNEKSDSSGMKYYTYIKKL